VLTAFGFVFGPRRVHGRLEAISCALVCRLLARLSEGPDPHFNQGKQSWRRFGLRRLSFVFYSLVPIKAVKTSLVTNAAYKSKLNSESVAMVQRKSCETGPELRKKGDLQGRIQRQIDAGSGDQHSLLNNPWVGGDQSCAKP